MATSPGSPWLTTHPLDGDDAAAAAAGRAQAAPMKGMLKDIAARGPFDGLMESVPAPKGVTFEAATVGGIPGWWVRPSDAEADAAILHIHGGWFNWGSARAFRNLAGQVALSAGANVFLPNYRLAPEHPFPAAVQDLEACYRGLVSQGISKIALLGDSAGGNLALVLLSLTVGKAQKGDVVPLGAVAFSPVTDLTFSGASYATRAEAEPYFTKPQVAALVHSYLGDAEPGNPLASPLFGNLSGLPPIRVHVGDDEVLLDDSQRYVARAVAAGVDATLDIWKGMPHGFVANIDGFNAAMQALIKSGGFLAERLKGADT